MAITYVNDLRLSEMDTGDNSGTWGTVTNTNLELIGEAFGFGTEAITTNADTHTSTIADGSTDPVRAMYVKYTGTLDSTCTITIGPNTVNKFYYIENGTSGSQDIIISQGSGANVTIPPGDVKAVYLDGAGSGAAVTDAFASLNVGSFTSEGGSTITVADNSTVLNLVSTDADADTGPKLDLTRNSASPAANDILGQIRFMGEDAADNSLSYVSMFAQLLDPTDGGEDGSFELDVRLAGSNRSRMISNATETVFNDDGQNIDFRIKTDAQADAFVIDAADDTITTTNQVVTITNNSNATQLVLQSTDADSSAGPVMEFYRNSSSPADNDATGLIYFTGENDADEKVFYGQIFSQIQDASDGTEDASIDFITMVGGTGRSRMFIAPTETVFNEASVDLDFRVESNGNAHMLFVDAANDRIGIGTSSPSQFVDIQSAETFNARLLATGNNTRAILLNQSHTSGGDDVNMVMGSFGDSSRGELSMNTNHPLRIYTNNDPNKGTEFETDGDVNILDGDLIISVSGHGVRFAGPTAQAGGTSQILDRYEEGTFTPTYEATGTAFGAIAYASQTGAYTIIGNVVTINILLKTSSYTAGSASGNVQINGLPFPAAGGTFLGAVGSVAAQDSWLNFFPLGGWINAADDIVLVNNTGDRTSYRQVPVANMATGSNKNRLYLTATYITSAI